MGITPVFFLLQSDDVEGLAVELDVTIVDVELLLPQLRLVLVEDRHPALGKAEFVEIVRKLRVGIVARKVLRRRQQPCRAPRSRLSTACSPEAARTPLPLRLPSPETESSSHVSSSVQT